jgi:protein SCO1/2
MASMEIRRRDLLSLAFARERVAEASPPVESSRIPDVSLRTHTGEAVRFHRDLIQNRTVVLHLLFAGWDEHARVTRNLVRLHDLLGDRAGRDVWILSLSIDPEPDSPEQLARFAEETGNREGWLYLTGAADEVDALRLALGVRDADPVVDADRSQYAGVLVLGDDRSDRWCSLPALLDPPSIAARIRRIAS